MLVSTILTVGLFSIAGCGLKGNLYLPGTEPETESAAPSATQSTAELATDPATQNQATDDSAKKQNQNKDESLTNANTDPTTEALNP